MLSCSLLSGETSCGTHLISQNGLLALLMFRNADQVEVLLAEQRYEVCAVLVERRNTFMVPSLAPKNGYANYCIFVKEKRLWNIVLHHDHLVNPCCGFYLR